MVVFAFAIRFLTTAIGAKNKSLGSPPALAYAVTRASGFTPCAFANASDVTTSALAPSFKPGAFPGVTVPSFSNDGLSAASVSSELSLRGPSSFSISVGPFFPGSSTETVSALKRHASIAATAFWWLASAKRSCSSRDTPAFLAVRSEEHTSELQSRQYLVCRLLLEKKKRAYRASA